jgi:hypothetical protein
MKILNSIAGAVCALALFAGTASAQIVIKAGHGAQSGHPTHFGLQKLAETVAAKSGGRIKIEVYPDRQLGEEREMIEGLQLGTVDMAVVSTGPLLAFAPKAGVLDLPFLFKNSAHAYKVLDGDIGKSLLKDMEARNIIGERLYAAVLSQIFELRAVQADPNPANFGFRKDGTVVLYDFGCVKDVRRDILQLYREVTISALSEDYDAVERCLIGLGARNLDGPPVSPAYYKTWRDIFLEPFLAPQPYDFGHTRMYERIMGEAKEFILRHAQAFQPPVELVFVDRAIAGTFGNVRAMKAIGDPTPLLDKYIHTLPEGLQAGA